MNLVCVKERAGWVDRTGVGHTWWWAGSYEVTPPGEGLGGWGRQVIMETSPGGESAGYWVRPHPRAQVVWRCLKTWRAT